MDKLIEVMNQDGYSKEFIDKVLGLANEIVEEYKEECN